MPKRTSYSIKQKILQAVREKPATYAQLERRLNTGYRTIKSNCEELEHFGFLSIQTENHPANNKPSHEVSITGQGMKVIKK